MATGTRSFRDFCWINMLTPQPADARAFFGALLGWTFMDIPQGHIIQVDGRPLGGLFDLNGPNTPTGTPPVIGVMVKVENADATCERVKQLGGTAKPAFDIGPQGRMAECFDPNGAEFDLWEPHANAGTDADARVHGATSWFESLTTDVEKAAPFYRELFGWTSDTVSMGAFDYTVFSLGDKQIAGMMPILPEMGSIPAHWGVYFTVADVDATAAQAVALGGSILMAPHDIQDTGRICGITSPQGVMFWTITYPR